MSDLREWTGLDSERKGKEKDVIAWVPGPGLRAAFALAFAFEFVAAWSQAVCAFACASSG